ncbi:hypothetical protein [Candidatus Nitrosotenuis sp. DW1]|uniref:hypothetical protein n=1 Tax=Candidatus Nitrosotenuis sp. DW1 TaxID=2259672 RepID=UPI0015C7807F|nr:hypothetical protein [Candidatus Nitrosotenuis sp. DW1]QLH09286.1 hypothetical protein DSQ19_07215 [Candidatus Nitrosotenuis sp. DW1]
MKLTQTSARLNRIHNKVVDVKKTFILSIAVAISFTLFFSIQTTGPLDLTVDNFALLTNSHANSDEATLLKMSTNSGGL